MLFDEDCSQDVRNQYASKALLIFFPFRELKDIYCTEGVENSSWTKLMELRGRLDSGLWKPGIDILQNHQNRVYNIRRLSKIKEPTSRKTVLNCEYNANHTRNENLELHDYDASMTADGVDYLVSTMIHPLLDCDSNGDIGTKLESTNDELDYEIPYSDSIIFLQRDTNDLNSQTNTTILNHNTTDRQSQDNIILFTIGFILPTSVTRSMESGNMNPIMTTESNMHDVARLHNLDEQ